MRPVVGFDLDLTLVDSADGIVATFQEVARRLGTTVDPSAVRQLIGMPLEDMWTAVTDSSRVAVAAASYRELAPEFGVPRTTLLPGAAEAVAAVRSHGGRAVVVSAKADHLIHATLDHVGLGVDAVVGSRFGPAKGEALREHGATVLVGDHPGDMVGARAAGAAAVGVTTGPHDAEQLRRAGAEVVLPDLDGFADWLDEYVLEARLAALDRSLRELGSVVVAFSGGADSAFVLAAAVRALDTDQVLAATAVSPSLPRRELAAAREFAERLGVRHVRPRTDELARAGYRANDGDRCYFCKAELLDVLGPLAEREGFARVVTGTNADDVLAGFRPGIRAAAERGAATPLRDAGLTKRQVRVASRRWGLPTWNKPAAACLSSRMAYGLEITPARLARVDRAESALRSVLSAAGIPVRDLRVRDLGDTARVEVDAALVARVADLSEVAGAVRDAGFTAVEIDPNGFRSGSMNELLPDPTRFR
jgi:pyridinium-3,5-biscarboxylic acid mononucleotide sulfurtransferase